MTDYEEPKKLWNLEGEVVEIIYKKTESERAPKVEIGFRMIVKRENAEKAIDEIAIHFRHLKESVLRKSLETSYYGTTDETNKVSEVSRKQKYKR